MISKLKEEVPYLLIFLMLDTDICSSGLLKKSFFQGCSKMPRCKAPEILRSEAYLDVRRNDER
jgi:hypothetical protein